ncbi:disease resistance protein At4g27190-like [Tasmannia lanceolata]|uniref:disease resistance protein At4g27190-like n=1 Tax=Tasmannia lanceolata TaxID=3420 RepID=UPI0040639F4B
MEFVWEIGKNVWEHCNYIRNLERNKGVLRSKMDELSSRENDVKTELDREEVQHGKKRKREVELWLEGVKKIKNEVHEIEEKIGEERRWFPRYRLGALVAKKITDVVEIQEKGRFDEALVLDPLLGSGSTLPTAQLVGKTTAEKTMEMIWDCLMNVEIGKIGVHGMGGVGKTTIMKHINNRLKETCLFHNIIWVTVSKEINLKRLQIDIAKAIGLSLPEDDDENIMSTKLFEALKRRKKFVLILDDLWETFQLEDIGIPEPNENNGCKLILTTRTLGVCQGMETQIDIRVEVLSEEEAWALFKDKVGNDVVISSEAGDVAKLVAKECGGLPLALITVGRALRKVDDVREWRNALNELRGSTMEIKGMKDNVFECLKFSYNRLTDHKIQACFLYCSLYPEDFEISPEELIEYWMGDGFIDEVGNREVEFDKGQCIVNELRRACLLETVVYGEVEYVMMHDLIRDVAIHITRVCPLFLVRAGVGLEELPKEKEWTKNVERISLMKNRIEILSGQPDCPRLSTLLLQDNFLSQKITNSFFAHMSSLRVLDLSRTRIESLPESLSDLGNLHVLLLRSNALKVVPSLSKLKKLRVLDLNGNLIKELPLGMEQLVHLRFLDLSYTHLQIFPAGIIPNLCLLEDLFMYRSSWEWSLNKGVMEGEIDEITKLKRLRNLHISFTDLPTFLNYNQSGHWRVLKSFHCTVRGSSPYLSHLFLNQNSIEIRHFDVVGIGSSLLLPNNTLKLTLSQCHGIIRLSQLSFLANLRDLKVCVIGGCNGMECILTAEENTIPSLETLNLDDLPNLRAIYEGVVAHGTFGSLKILSIKNCDNLKNLFWVGLLQHLQNLEVIQIWNCCLMEDVVVGEQNMGQANTPITLPMLRKIDLKSLPELKSICWRMICHSLETISVCNCPKLKKLPLSVNNLPRALKSIIGSIEWWDALELDHSNTKTLLQPLFRGGE